MPVISIIVPVYNVEPYLRKCLESIIAQTFTDFECILINDGSTDNSPAICDEYTEKDGRLIVIHQKNAGVSAARNAGLDIVRGEWIGFVDSDDWVDDKYLEYLYGNAVKNDVDVSVCGINTFKNGKVSHRDKYLYDVMLTSKEAISLMFARESSFGGFSFNKLFKKQLIERDNFRYDNEIKYLEDVLFFYDIFKITDKVYYSSQPYYFYRQTETSVTNQVGFTPAVATGITVLENLYEKEQDIEIKEILYLNKIYFIYGTCVGCILKRKKDEAFRTNLRILREYSFRKHFLPFIFRCKIFILVYLSFLMSPYFYIKNLCVAK